MLVVRLTQTTNFVVTAPQDPSLADADPLTFDTALDDYDGTSSPSGFWSIGDPTKIILTRDLLRCTVEVHVTTLGGDGGTVNYYGGWDNSDVVTSVVKNWDGTGVYLDKTIAAVRCSHTGSVSAQIDELSQFVGDLESGDELQVVLAGPAGFLLVEANPSTIGGGYPGNYRAATGTGVIGTHFVLRGT